MKIFKDFKDRFNKLLLRFVFIRGLIANFLYVDTIQNCVALKSQICALIFCPSKKYNTQSK